MAIEFSYNPDDEYKFAETVGDSNPIHLDVELAEKSFFKKRIVHGAFLAGLISKVLGMDFPGQAPCIFHRHQHSNAQSMWIQRLRLK